jgi:hypothetical protein
MSWIDQGRQEHGWFGHGASGAARLDPFDPDGRSELRARTFAAVEFAADVLHSAGERASFNLTATRDKMRELTPAWAAGAHPAPDIFRQIFFGKDFDPVEAWGIQSTVLALMHADTHATLKDTGPKLADAIRTIGLGAWLGFLRDAQDRVAQLQAPVAPASFDPAAPAAGAASNARRTSGPRLDGSGDRIRPVFPLELLAGGAEAALTKGALGVARVLGGAILLRILPEQPPEPPPSEPPIAPESPPKPGDAFPDRELPRSPKSGEPLPDPEAEHAPHTQLGIKRSKRSPPYPQAREFDENGKHLRDIDFTDHGRPREHTNPHQHRYIPNPTGGTRQRPQAEPLR